MIDEYIVDYEEYVGIGCGAFCFLDGAIYVNTFSLRDYAERIDGGHDAGALQTRAFGRNERMRYRFLMSLFGMTLDKRAVRAGLRRRPSSMGCRSRWRSCARSGAFAVDNAEVLDAHARRAATCSSR